MNTVLTFIILLPLIVSSSVAVYIAPEAPGQYSIDQWLSAHIDAPGCYGISFEAPAELQFPHDCVVYHGECWDSTGDDVPDHGTVNVSFMHPVTIVNPTFKIYPSGKLVTKEGV